MDRQQFEHDNPGWTLGDNGEKLALRPMSRLFVYGIFLGERTRQAYGMTNPNYDTVRDYVTYGGAIVTAYKQESAGLALTGLVVDVDPKRWGAIDNLEAGYDRIKVITTSGVEAYMYAGKEL